MKMTNMTKFIIRRLSMTRKGVSFPANKPCLGFGACCLQTAASIWFEIWGSWIRVKKNIFIQLNFLMTFFSNLHINSKMYIYPGEIFLRYAEIFLSWGKVTNLERVFFNNNI